MRITKERRAFINACKKDFDKQGITPKVLAKLYRERYELFDNDSEIVPLVEIAINEYAEEKRWKLEIGLEIALSKIRGE